MQAKKAANPAAFFMACRSAYFFQPIILYFETWKK